MISTTEHIQRAIKNNRKIRQAVKDMPNDQELGDYVRQVYSKEIEEADKRQQSINFPEPDETFLTVYKYK